MSHSPSGEPHPGTITFDDRVRGTIDEQPASSVPESIAWVAVGDTWVPVTKVEITGTPDMLRMTSFGPDGAMLETTTRHR